MEDARKLVFAILQFFDEQQRSPNLSPDAIESLEVASQCLESAYDVSIRDTSLISRYQLPASLQNIFNAGLSQLSDSTPVVVDREMAEKLKTEGNEFMRREMYEAAVNSYTEAIKCDPKNAVYFCNRAAAQAKMGNNEGSIDDCLQAISIDPAYAKAYGRKGLAHSALGQTEEAVNSFRKASELDPSNESYRDNLRMSEQHLSANAGSPSAGFGGLNLGGMDFGSLLNNPALMNMATNLLSNPQMQSMMANMMTGLNGQAAETGANPVSGLLQAGQQLAQQMQQSNPDLVQILRNQMGQGQDQNNPDQNGESGDNQE